MLVNNTNDILIILLSISVWVNCISHIPKPKCREKEFLEFFPESDYWNLKFPGSEIPGLLYLTEKWLRKNQKVVLTSTGNSARKFHWLGISESPSEIWLSQDVEDVLISTGNSTRIFLRLGYSGWPGISGCHLYRNFRVPEAANGQILGGGYIPPHSLKNS